MDESVIAQGPVDVLVKNDWQRTLRKSACACGQPVLIEYDAPGRADGKRCRQPVSVTVPGAEYGGER